MPSRSRRADEVGSEISPKPSQPHREVVLGQPVDAVSRADSVAAVVERGLAGPPGGYVCLTNVHTTVESQRNHELRRAANGSMLSVPDGMPLVWILHRRGFAHTQKVTGIEFVPEVARAGVPRGLRHLLYGGAPGIAQGAAVGLRRLVPGAEVVGAMTPPFSEAGDWPVQDLADEVARTDAHVVWIGLGAPKQEIWMARAARVVNAPVMVGVGAAFDFLAGSKRPAPRWVSRIGFEWLFRLASEPRRLWRRYLGGNSRFLYLLARERLSWRPKH